MGTIQHACIRRVGAACFVCTLCLATRADRPFRTAGTQMAKQRERAMQNGTRWKSGERL